MYHRHRRHHHRHHYYYHQYELPTRPMCIIRNSNNIIIIIIIKTYVYYKQQHQYHHYYHQYELPPTGAACTMVCYTNFPACLGYHRGPCHHELHRLYHYDHHPAVYARRAAIQHQTGMSLQNEGMVF